MRRRGDANARMDNRRRGRDWPNLVGRGNVQLSSSGRIGRATATGSPGFALAPPGTNGRLARWEAADRPPFPLPVLGRLPRA